MKLRFTKNLNHWWLFGLSLVVMVLIVFLAHDRAGNQIKINLISDYDWSHMAGATRIDSKVEFKALNRQIVNQDGSGGQPNPPVNLAGPVIDFRSDFDLTATVKDFDEGDSLSLYGGVPIIYDEWRYEPPSIKIYITDTYLKIDIYEGESSQPKIMKFKIDAAPINKLSLERRGQSLAIYVNNSFTGSIKPKQLFQNNQLRVGAEANNNWALNSLILSGSQAEVGVNKGLNFSKSTSYSGGLQNLANQNKHSLKIGAAVALNPLLTDVKYRDLALYQFGIWTPENELKPQFIQPMQNNYSFSEADLIIDTALKNNILIHGHALVFGEANPKWMQNSKLADRQTIMTNHIKETVGHFKGRVHEWDVVNEPLSDNDEDYSGDGLRHHLWYQAMGEVYISSALNTAHQVDPSADLYINDYGLEADGQRWDALIKLVKKLQSQAVPLSGIGFESHIYEKGDEVDSSVLLRHLNQLKDMGLKARISEIDVHGEDTKVQSQQYKTVLKACQSAPNCVAFSTWGISDKYGSTTEINTYPLEYGNDLLWSKDFDAKPAYYELAKILKDQ